MIMSALLGIVILAAVLRFYRIGEKTIWLDEGFQYLDGQPLPAGCGPLVH